ncbi:hypothetical protein F4604DRAFT_1677595 [Suillus subluteus]|nr:hypothetical protein F4604DRAFT_1677595 [Suillus subluteus]
MSRNGGLAVAYGHIARHQPKQLDGVNVSKTRIVITVTSILVPAYLVRADLTSETTPQNSTTILPSSPYEPHDSPYLQVDEIEDSEPTTDSDVGEWLSQDRDSGVPEQLASDAEKDLHGLSQIESLAKLVSRNVTIESNEFKISIHHGLHCPFSCALRDAIFLPDPVDLAAVEEVLKKKNMCFCQMVLTNSDWVWQRIKQLVAPPEILAPRVTEVLQTYGPLRDAVTGQPLFNDASWEKARLVIENIKLGKIYLGSYDIWTRNRIALLVDITASVVWPSYQECGQVTWLNGNDFEPMNESFGILPVAAATRTKLGMSQYRDDYAKGWRKQPNWVALAQEWQHHANSTHIFYKLPEQLKSYYKTWNEHQNEHNSVEQNNSAYLELQKLLAAPVGMPEIAPAPCQTVAEQIDGCQASANKEPTDWQISMMLGRNSSRQTLLQLQYSDPALPGPHGQKRPAEEEAVAPVRVKQRAQRTCKKCHKPDCPGAFKSRPCKYKQLNVNSQQRLDAPQ